MRKSFLEIIMLKIVQQVSRFLTFFITQNEAAGIEDIHLHTGWLLAPATSETVVGLLCHQTHLWIIRVPNHHHGQLSVVQRFLPQLNIDSKERGQTSWDNALDGDKNVSMELYSKTKIAALYLMCTHFTLAICLK